MLILEWPRSWYRFVSARFYLSSASQASPNPWLGRASVYGPHRQLWRCELQTAPMEDWEWRPMSALFSEIGGASGLIRISDPRRIYPQYNQEEYLGEGSWSDDTYFDDGTGWLDGALPTSIHVVTAAGRGATALHVGGLGASIARSLRRGDLIEIRRDGIADETPSLHEVLRDAPTDANGETLLKIAPGLRKGVAGGDMVVTEYATGVFRCADDDQGIVDVSGRMIGQTGFTLIENII